MVSEVSRELRWLTNLARILVRSWYGWLFFSQLKVKILCQKYCYGDWILTCLRAAQCQTCELLHVSNRTASYTKCWSAMICRKRWYYWSAFSNQHAAIDEEEGVQECILSLHAKYDVFPSATRGDLAQEECLYSSVWFHQSSSKFLFSVLDAPWRWQEIWVSISFPTRTFWRTSYTV